VLSTGKPCVDLGGDYYIRERLGATIHKAINQLKAVGINPTFTSTTEAVVT